MHKSTVDEDKWPPNQPKGYTLLVLIRNQEQNTKQHDSEMGKWPHYPKQVTLTQ